MVKKTKRSEANNCETTLNYETTPNRRTQATNRRPERARPAIDRQGVPTILSYSDTASPSTPHNQRTVSGYNDFGSARRRLFDSYSPIVDSGDLSSSDSPIVDSGDLSSSDSDSVDSDNFSGSGSDFSLDYIESSDSEYNSDSSLSP